MKSRLLSIYQSLPLPVKNLASAIQGYKLNQRRTQNREQLLRILEERDSWTKAQFATWQQEELKQMLDHAVKNVPYYRAMWQDIWSKDNSISHLELKNWPILEKATIKKDPAQFIADNYKDKKLYEMYTSGSSGTPMQYWFNSEALSLWYAIYEHRIKRWNGVSDRDNWANIGGQLIYKIDQTKPPFWTWNFAMRQLYLSSYHIKPQNTKYYIEALKKYKVKFLLGYVSSIYNIAREGLEQGLELPTLKLVITNAEPLLEHQRETIVRAFNCKVIQTYSGCEFAFGGNEDLTGRMYLWPEAGIMEVVDENDKLLPDGQIGNFVITGLVNKVMPLIRFRVGDSGALLPQEKYTAQDRQFPILQEVTGRNDDLVVTPDGKLVGRLDPVFKGDFNIKEAQIIQETKDVIRIIYVPSTGFSVDQINEVKQRLQDRVGYLMNIITEEVAAIPRSANGKFKAVVSKLKK